MSFRRKLLALFALTVFVSVAAVVTIVSYATRRAFERTNEERTEALVAQFRREFGRRGEEIGRRIDAVASSDTAARMALALDRGLPDYGANLNTARTIADSQQLDFLEFVDSQGTIISSAQWPAKFGYRESLPLTRVSQDAFLKQEDLPDGAVLGLVAMRVINSGEKPLYAIGGRKIDKNFLASLELPQGMRALFYESLSSQSAGAGFSPQLLIAPSGPVQQPERLAPLVQQVQQQKQEATGVVHWTDDAAENEVFQAFPLAGPEGQVLGVLLVGSSQRPYVELRRHIRSAALLAGGAGILLAILFSGWAAGRVTRPVEHLAKAAREVAAGDWTAQAPVTTSDELGELAETFNRMTHEMLEQRQRLVQTERVAAWRELARRLAHELKNPLFPLQLTVENLLRSRQLGPEQFEETFRESSSTLLAEIANLKAIISRFSEFSKMPSPQFQRVNLNDVVQQVVRLFQAQLRAPDRAAIECKLELGEMQAIAADPELLHRVLSNLVLNAMDAMPQGGTLAVRTRYQDDRAVVEVADSGAGLTPEECERLFTPYYTSKAHGTGLGLAIVQSVVSDHGGKISVQSTPGRGSTFLIELPANADKLQKPASAASVTS